MAKQGKFAGRLKRRLRAALDALELAGRQDVACRVESAWRAWWKARRPAGRVEQRPPATPAPAPQIRVLPSRNLNVTKVWRLYRRLNAAADAMRVGGRVAEARTVVQRWYAWRRSLLPGEVKKRRMAELKLARRLERRKRRQLKRAKRKRRQRRAELLAADVRDWRDKLREAAMAAPRPEIEVRFLADLYVPEERWHSERHSVEVLPWIAVCALHHLEAHGRSRDDAVGRLRLLIARHEAEGPSGNDKRARRLFPFPTPTEFVQPVPPQCRPKLQIR